MKPAEVVVTIWVVILLTCVALVLVGEWVPWGIWLRDASAPGWVQAIGALLALVVAIGVGWYQTARTVTFQQEVVREERRRQIAAAKAILQTIRPTFDFHLHLLVAANHGAPTPQRVRTLDSAAQLLMQAALSPMPAKAVAALMVAASAVDELDRLIAAVDGTQLGANTGIFAAAREYEVRFDHAQKEIDDLSKAAF